MRVYEHYRSSNNQSIYYDNRRIGLGYNIYNNLSLSSEDKKGSDTSTYGRVWNPNSNSNQNNNNNQSNNSNKSKYKW